MNNWSHGDLILLFFIREDRQYPSAEAKFIWIMLSVCTVIAAVKILFIMSILQ